MLAHSTKIAAGLLLAVALAACSGAAASSPEASADSSQAASAAPSADSSAAASVEPSAAASPAEVSKVSANDATRDELVAALTAAGVANADKWADEIIEYRPYDATDTTLQALQDNLAKYNPDAATVAGILSVLEP